MSETLHYTDTDTLFGTIGIIWKPTTLKVQRIVLKEQPQHTIKQPENPPPEIQTLLDSINHFLQGEDLTINITPLDLDLCTEFQRKVLLAEYNIPRGTVSTYARIAKHIGKPKAARAVGNALATNPFPIAIPCHRAIKSDLTLGGYQGGTQMKKQLLQMEGIQITNNQADNPKITY